MREDRGITFLYLISLILSCKDPVSRARVKTTMVVKAKNHFDAVVLQEVAVPTSRDRIKTNVQANKGKDSNSKRREIAVTSIQG